MVDGINYDTVPVEYMADGIRRYVEEGIDPGGFMLSMLSNDLFGAVMRADPNNLTKIPHWVAWMAENLPRDCYGSPDRVAKWKAGETR